MTKEKVAFWNVWDFYFFIIGYCVIFANEIPQSSESSVEPSENMRLRLMCIFIVCNYSKLLGMCFQSTTEPECQHANDLNLGHSARSKGLQGWIRFKIYCRVLLFQNSENARQVSYNYMTIWTLTLSSTF